MWPDTIVATSARAQMAKGDQQATSGRTDGKAAAGDTAIASQSSLTPWSFEPVADSTMLTQEEWAIAQGFGQDTLGDAADLVPESHTPFLAVRASKASRRVSALYHDLSRNASPLRPRPFFPGALGSRLCTRVLRCATHPALLAPHRIDLCLGNWRNSSTRTVPLAWRAARRDHSRSPGVR